MKNPASSLYDNSVSQRIETTLLTLVVDWPSEVRR